MEPQEQFVIDYYKRTQNLFFIDIGANDGVTINTTIHLEKDYNWDGICIEPNPDAFNKLKDNRKVKIYNCGIADSNKDLIFCKITGYSEMLSGFEDLYSEKQIKRIEKEVAEKNQKIERIPIKTRRLDDILYENNINKVDFLGIDTEGAELSILKSVDLNKYDINLISVEDNYDDKIVDAYLNEYGYRPIARICLDNFFCKS